MNSIGATVAYAQAPPPPTRSTSELVSELHDVSTTLEIQAREIERKLFGPVPEKAESEVVGWGCLQDSLEGLLQRLRQLQHKISHVNERI